MISLFETHVAAKCVKRAEIRPFISYLLGFYFTMCDYVKADGSKVDYSHSELNYAFAILLLALST